MRNHLLPDRQRLSLSLYDLDLSHSSGDAAELAVAAMIVGAWGNNVMPVLCLRSLKMPILCPA